MRKVLLIGSVGLDDRESVFRLLAQHIAGCATRFPDGEIPPRNRWMMWQRDIFAAHPSFVLDSQRQVHFGGRDQVFERYRLADGADPSTTRLGELGYAAEAIRSYEVFHRLKADSVIPRTTRFQMSLPSPVAVCTQHIADSDQSCVEGIYEVAISREIQEMLAHIPANELSIQWDICQEVLAIEGAWAVYYEDRRGGAIKRLIRLAGFVPEPCEVGFHFCYGDPGHKHIKEPKDLDVCVTLANELCAGSDRAVGWVHMPVPQSRADSQYFSPLGRLAIPTETELYLGLIHLTDSVEGARSRIQAASVFVDRFGVATECGFGRRPVSTIPDLLELHARIAEL